MDHDPWVCRQEKRGGPSHDDEALENRVGPGGSRGRGAAGAGWPCRRLRWFHPPPARRHSEIGRRQHQQSGIAGSPGWLRVADYIEKNKLKAGFGIICTSLEKDNQAYFRWIKDVAQRGAIEFWFHGYDHAVHTENGTQFNEFNSRSYEDQKQRFDRSQRLAQQHLGLVFHAFGPGGGTHNGLFDANTVRVMADEPECASGSTRSPWTRPAESCKPRARW